MKSSLKNQTLFILTLWLWCHTPLILTAQQKNPDQSISLSALNEPVSAVLERLSRNTGITFSYNPDHIEASRLITFNMKDKTLSEVLNVIVPPEKFGFRFSGKQVVIYRKPIATDQTITPAVQVMKPGIENSGIPLRDTVYINQTTIQQDTITLLDTILKFDTVYMMRTIVRDNSISGKEIFPDQTSLPKEQTKTFKVEAGASLTWLKVNPFYNAPFAFNEKLGVFRNSNSGGQISGSIGIDVKVSYARFSFGSGISFTSFNGRLDYNYEISTGGFFLKDTLDAYYTLNDPDTTWYYVLDSTYLPVNIEAYGYKTSVRHQYFEIPFCLQYNQPVGRMLIYAAGGVLAGIHSGSNGLMILPVEDGVINMNEVKFKPLVFSWLIAAGILIPVNDRLTFDGGFTYRQHFNSILADFPISVRNQSFGIRAGIIYKF